MTYEESKSLAREMATDELRKHFDVEAFLILSVLELNGNNMSDKVPESRIDEHIDSLEDFFARYMQSRTNANLEAMLTQTEQILTEMYHSLEKPEELFSFRNFIGRLQNIIL